MVNKKEENKMEDRMNKKQVLNETIKVLAGISVPIALRSQITDPIEGVISNLVIVLQMIDAEEKANNPEEAEDDGGFKEVTDETDETMKEVS